MSNQYAYNGGFEAYSPPPSEGQMSGSPIFHNMQYSDGSNGTTLSSLSSSTALSVTSNYLLHNPRLRYYLLKLFDAEDDLEFCPDIPENPRTSPSIKKFNPYTASVFSPTGIVPDPIPLQPPNITGIRVRTPRAKKAIEIVNPHTKVREGSPALGK